MSRQYGAKVQLLGKFESDYGTPPSGDYIQFPFVENDIDTAQGLIASDILGLGRDPAAPIRDVKKLAGVVKVPVDVRNFGQWLKATFGVPDTTGMSAPYTHVFSSGGDPLSMALEVGYPDVPEFAMHAGLKVNSLGFDFKRSGAASCDVNMIGQGTARNTTSGGGTPTTAGFNRFNQFQGSIKKDSSTLANITSANATYSNNLSTVETIRSDGKIDGADATIAAFTGNIVSRFADTTLLDLAEDGTPFELEFAYEIDSSNKLVIKAYEVYLPRPKIGIKGPDGVEVTFDFQAANNVSAGKMLDVTLINDVASYA